MTGGAAQQRANPGQDFLDDENGFAT